MGAIVKKVAPTKPLKEKRDVLGTLGTTDRKSYSAGGVFAPAGVVG